MSTYLILKTLHVLSSVFLAGVGFGSAYYLFFANRSNSVAAQAVVGRLVARADWVFTTPAGFIQPITGFALMHMAGWKMSTPWIAWTLVLYVLAGACWLPVLWLQLRMKNMAEQAVASNSALPALYWRYARWWEALGYPAFVAMVIIYFLMVAKPNLPWPWQ
ncbi:DUF2269 domain-containing protein [Noviherbaspirillum sp. CPCC 100848]|uniref:DUF2269 domain-containing protein n=1 Tax=Noviherbaspirillum album TaxID=3080276 RepID=A0ABU6JF42_9BURK|nr:DUF2269 domain-containing protein [Noviherbaspirillum sp. CPCC 100848]MEC4722284.1 DUF2269 domain-containing protein [Noviherbaspirillum sp. CPCC 100848]